MLSQTIFVGCPREQSAGNVHDKPICRRDEPNAPSRFYDIEVVATDHAGNTGQFKATVIILYEGYKERVPNDVLHFIRYARSNPALNVIAKKSLTWSTSGTSSAASSEATANSQSAVTVETSFEVSGIQVPTNQTDAEAMRDAIALAVRQTVCAGYTPDACTVQVQDFGQRRHLQEAAVYVTFTITLLEDCVPTCADDGGSAVLEMVRNQITDAVATGSFTDILQEVSAELGVASLANVTVVAADVSEDVIEESWVDVALSSHVLLRGFDVGSLGGDAVAALLVSLSTAIESLGCQPINVKSCTAHVVSHTDQRNRHLQAGSTPMTQFTYEVLIEVDCNSGDCSDVQALEESLNNAVSMICCTLG